MARYDWNPIKASSNYSKHRIHFADSIGVFEDDRAITIEDTSTAEKRFKTLGMDFLGRVLVVVYTYRGGIIRLITARKATAPQRALYERTRR